MDSILAQLNAVSPAREKKAPNFRLDPRYKGEDKAGSFQQDFRRLLGLGNHIHIPQHVGDFQLRQAVLPGAEEISRPRSFKSSSAIRKPSLVRHIAFKRYTASLILGVGNQNTVAFRLSPAYPAPKLVKLGKAEPLGVFNEHDYRVRYVHPYLDDGGGNQKIQLSLGKGAHHPLFFRGLIRPWSRPTRYCRNSRFSGFQRIPPQRPDCFHLTHSPPEGRRCSPAAPGPGALQKAVGPASFLGVDPKGVDFLPAWRQFV